jgi:hypothetical protein
MADATSSASVLILLTPPPPQIDVFSVICVIYELIPYVMRVEPRKFARATAL